MLDKKKRNIFFRFCKARKDHIGFLLKVPGRQKAIDSVKWQMDFKLSPLTPCDWGGHDFPS